jgi:TetR/AcrR family transcriptional regulator, cholesterol catabolism regulator
MRDIADACGLLAGSLYSHFKSKSEILELVIGPFYDQLVPAQEAAAAMPGTGAERTEEMLRRVFKVLAACNDEMTIIHYDWQDLLEVEDFSDIRDRSNYMLELWYQVIAAGIEDGTLRPEIDPEITVRIVTSSLHGLLDRKRYGARPSPLAVAGFDDLVEEFVLLMVCGLRSDGAHPPESLRHLKSASKAGKAKAVTTKSAAGSKAARTDAVTPTTKKAKKRSASDVVAPVAKATSKKAARVPRHS